MVVVLDMRWLEDLPFDRICQVGPKETGGALRGVEWAVLAPRDHRGEVVDRPSVGGTCGADSVAGYATKRGLRY